MPDLHHHPGCDPRDRSRFSCPCGVLDRWAEAQEALAEAHLDAERDRREAYR